MLAVTATALAATGALTQPAGTAGCVSQDGTGPCADGRALATARGVAVSPDGKSVYVAAKGVARLNRNPTTGAITQPAGTAGCVSATGAGPCADGNALRYPHGVAVSPDGKSVYVASYNGVARLNRKTTTGAITQPAGTAGCVSEAGTGGTCADGHALDYPIAVAVSPDGKSVYIASYDSDAVVRFNRNPTTGALSEPAGTAGCVSQDGTGPCADGHALSGPSGVAVSPDAKSLNVASYKSHAVALLNRNTSTGALTQPAGTAGCVSEDGTGPCADGHALKTPDSVAVSADGKSAYLAAFFGNAVARFNRAP